ncbi:MAG: tyrosyl-tRNA synthetase, partial [Bacteroidota bacterium]|nr:tyrosyl-tRNA synthetase [Bacteroidota bacterium]
RSYGSPDSRRLYSNDWRPIWQIKTRPQLTMEETRVNGQSYLEQATLVLSEKNLEVRYNSEWLSKMTFTDVINLAAKYTVAQILERDDFDKRYKSGAPISIHELLYPLAQAMDSAAIFSDVELGGTDQKFNLIVGREIQKAYGQEPQCIATMPILEGLDGIEKMSKSLNNYIGITDTPREMFGKAMSIPDNLIVRYYQYGSFPSNAKIKELSEELANGTLHPRNAKVQAAMGIVSLYHGAEAAQAAFDEFERIFVRKDLPDEIEEKILELENPEQNAIDILSLTGLAPSKKEARRLIEQGGVYVDGERISDPFQKFNLTEQKLFKVGKRKFLRISVKG